MFYFPVSAEWKKIPTVIWQLKKYCTHLDDRYDSIELFFCSVLSHLFFFSQKCVTSRGSYHRSLQSFVFFSWLVKILFRKKEKKKILAWNSRWKESCLTDQEEKNLQRVIRHFKFLEVPKKFSFFPLKILIWSSRQITRNTFAHI